LVEKQDFVKEPDEKEGHVSTKQERVLEREIIEAVYDEQSLWVRKLIEILVNLINFQDTNFNEAFRIYLSAENLELFLGKQKDFKDFYAFASGNIESSIQDYLQRIETDLKTLGLQNIWFVDQGRLKAKALPIFSSVLSRYKLISEALNQMLGISQSYRSTL
jgi:hypothetical protein